MFYSLLIPFFLLLLPVGLFLYVIICAAKKADTLNEIVMKNETTEETKKQ
ncbi:MAG: hypothetical protein NTW61_05310 [Candidatus Melainabacteria bacterium]|jgi:hypothetical protein|nr:hypothetical protein [Candidatus Melainabacteria bacterium]